MRFLIYDAEGNRVNTIVATKTFVENYCEVNGYTYEKVSDPDPTPAPEPETEPSVWDELDAAWDSGYTEGYREGVNTAYDQ